MNNTISLLFAGDFTPPENTENTYSDELKDVLNDKDFSLVNLETPLTNSDNKIEKTGNNFKRPPSTIKHIKNGYFDAVALSNNHIRDYGDEGVNDTIETCNVNNIQTVGAGKNIEEAKKPLRIQVKGKKISILNYSEREFNIASDTKAGANPYDNISAFYDIQKEKQENDYVIVVYHGGLEYQYYPTPEMVRKFKYMIDVGADAVISHHTHRISGVMSYNNKPLVFGLGNFLAHTKGVPAKDWLTGLIVRLSINSDSVTVDYFPVEMAKSFDHVKVLLDMEQKTVLKKIKEINTIIKEERLLQDYWKKQDQIAKARTIRILKSNSFFEYRLRKYLSVFFIKKLSDYKRKNLVNIIQCDSHREQLVRIFNAKQ